MSHQLRYDEGGEGNMGWIKPVCSCGWQGGQHYAYNDTQYTDANREAGNHLRDVQGASTQSTSAANSKEGGE
jgi:hypothetical protein